MPRTYHSVNVSREQQMFLKLLNDYEVEIFSISEIEKILNHPFSNLNGILENLESKGFLSRIERGKYCLANFRDENVIGSFISGDGAVAYWSALNYHGLTEQFPNVVFIQTTKPKKDKSVFGTNYKFVKVIPQKLKGIIKEGYGARTYRITDVEKTLVDCFDYPQYSGGYAELIRAFVNAQLSGERIIDYCKAVSNIAATKRMGYLAELFEKKELRSFISFAKDQVKDAYNPLDPQGLTSGPFNTEWKLRLNISREELLDIANKQY
jgi:predicted transcriptional regulator of viral defense system